MDPHDISTWDYDSARAVYTPPAGMLTKDVISVGIASAKLTGMLVQVQFKDWDSLPGSGYGWPFISVDSVEDYHSISSFASHWEQPWPT